MIKTIKIIYHFHETYTHKLNNTPDLYINL